MKRFNIYNAAFFAAALLAILVIAAELSKQFKTILADIFGHHWIGKGILITVAFVVTGFAWKNDKIVGLKNEKLAWYGMIGSLALILLFYIIHY